MDDFLKLVEILKWPAVAVMGLLIFRTSIAVLRGADRGSNGLLDSPQSR